MVVSFSAPSTSDVSLWPEAIRPSATVSAKRKPGHAAPMSKAARVLGAEQRLEVARRGGEQPVGRGGAEDDGVEIGRGDPGALQRTQRRVAAQQATVSSGAAMRRSRIPVRSTIH